jgi:competence protein ComEC
MKNKLKHIIIIEIVMLAALILLFGIVQYHKMNAGSNEENAQQQSAQESETQPEITLPLDVTFFDVGKGDCILIETAEGAIMIDTGYDENGEDILEWLKEREIDTIEYLILTHPDKDHIGGADSIISQINVKNIIDTNCVVDKDDYIEYKQAAASKGLGILTLTSTKEIDLGGAQLTIYPPLSSNFEGQNDYSLVTKMIYGETDFLFAGDAEDDRIEELLKQIPNVESMLLKVPHHGTLMDDSEMFFKAVAPQYSIITCDKKKMFEDVTDMLQSLNSKVYTTNDGDITVRSDGEKMTISQ